MNVVEGLLHKFFELQVIMLLTLERKIGTISMSKRFHAYLILKLGHTFLMECNEFEDSNFFFHNNSEYHVVIAQNKLRI